MEMERCEMHFVEELHEFKVYQTYVDNLQQLTKNMMALCELRRQENVEAYSREVEVPLSRAKEVILISEDKYTTAFSLTQFVCFYAFYVHPNNVKHFFQIS